MYALLGQLLSPVHATLNTRVVDPSGQESHLRPILAPPQGELCISSILGSLARCQLTSAGRQLDPRRRRYELTKQVRPKEDRAESCQHTHPSTLARLEGLLHPVS